VALSLSFFFPFVHAIQPKNLALGRSNGDVGETPLSGVRSALSFSFSFSLGGTGCSEALTRLGQKPMAGHLPSFSSAEAGQGCRPPRSAFYGRTRRQQLVATFFFLFFFLPISGRKRGNQKTPPPPPAPNPPPPTAVSGHGWAFVEETGPGGLGLLFFFFLARTPCDRSRRGRRSPPHLAVAVNGAFFLPTPSPLFFLSRLLAAQVDMAVIEVVAVPCIVHDTPSS